MINQFTIERDGNAVLLREQERREIELNQQRQDNQAGRRQILGQEQLIEQLRRDFAELRRETASQRRQM